MCVRWGLGWPTGCSSTPRSPALRCFKALARPQEASPGIPVPPAAKANTAPNAERNTQSYFHKKKTATIFIYSQWNISPDLKRKMSKERLGHTQGTHSTEADDLEE